MSKPTDSERLLELLTAAGPELLDLATKLITERDDFKEWYYSEPRSEGQEPHRAVMIALRPTS